MDRDYKLVCKECGRTPAEIEEYSYWNTQSGLDSDDYVKQEEGTYNPETGRFWCTNCYINIGMPLGKA